jgi:hypothetical protein
MPNSSTAQALASFVLARIQWIYGRSGLRYSGKSGPLWSPLRFRHRDRYRDIDTQAMVGKLPYGDGHSFKSANLPLQDNKVLVDRIGTSD